jgi:hypothetical protein
MWLHSGTVGVDRHGIPHIGVCHGSSNIIGEVLLHKYLKVNIVSISSQLERLLDSSSSDEVTEIEGNSADLLALWHCRKVAFHLNLGFLFLEFTILLFVETTYARELLAIKFHSLHVHP